MYVLVEERFCKSFFNGVEDEVHVLLECPLYQDIREDFFYRAHLYNPVFNSLKKEENVVHKS
jgi:hypothetical protein